MLKHLVKDSVVYGVANAVQKMIPFFIIPIVTGYLGPDAFKIYDVSFLYAYLFSWLIICGQDAAAATLFFDQKKNIFDKRQVSAYGLFIQLAILIACFCLLLPFSDNWGSLLFAKDISIARWWRKALLILPGFIALNFALNVLMWQKRKTLYVLLCSVLTLLSIASVEIMVVFLNGGLAELFYCLIGSMSFCGLLGLFLVRRDIFSSFTPINTALLKKLFLLGIPFGLTAFFHQLLPSVDRYFLIQFNYTGSLAVYALAAKLGAFMNFGISAFVLAFTPYSLAKLNEDDAEQEISALFRIISIISFLVIPFLLFFKDALVLLFGDPSYRLAANLLPFFFFGWVFDLFSYFSLLGIYRSQKSVLQLAIFAVATCFISVSNLLLVPAYGLYGAAISFCVTKLVVFIISLVWLRRYFDLQIRWVSFLSALLIGLICSYLIYILPMAASVCVWFFTSGAICLIFFRNGPHKKNAVSFF